MVKIDAIVNMEKMEDVKDALQAMEVHGMTISQVMGCGAQMGYTQTVRGSKVDVNLLPKVKFEVVVSSIKWAEKTVEAIRNAAYTGNKGPMNVVRKRCGKKGRRNNRLVRGVKDENSFFTPLRKFLVKINMRNLSCNKVKKNK